MVAQANEGSVIADRDYTGGGGELTVEVFSPRVPEPKKFTWAEVPQGRRRGRPSREGLRL